MLKNLIRKNILKLSKKTMSVKLELPTKIYLKHEYLKTDFWNLTAKLNLCTKQEEIINFLKTEGHRINDEILALVTEKLIFNRIFLDTDFEKEAIPYFCHYLSLMNKGQAKYFGVIVKNLSMLEIESVQLWKTISTVIAKNEMQKFVSLDNLGHIFYHLSLWKKPPLFLMSRIYNVLKIHKQSFDLEMQEKIDEVLESNTFPQIERLSQENILELEN